MKTVSWDLWVDFQRAEDNGLTRGNVRHARSGVELHVGAFIIVGNEDAESGVAEVVELGDRGFVLLRVFPGSVADNRHRLGRDTTTGD
jgi:hypothetical protein